MHKIQTTGSTQGSKTQLFPKHPPGPSPKKLKGMHINWCANDIKKTKTSSEAN
jgi:hypothetical protein